VSARDRARAALEGVTPGEWRQGNVERYHVFVECRDAESLGHERVLLRMNTHFEHEADARFVAAAPTLVRELADEVDALRSLLGESVRIGVDIAEYFDLNDPLAGAAVKRLATIRREGGVE
jgi:hypothetical protein